MKRATIALFFFLAFNINVYPDIFDTFTKPITRAFDAGHAVVDKSSQIVDAAQVIVNSIKNSINQIKSTIQQASQVKQEIIEPLSSLPDQVNQAVTDPVNHIAKMSGDLSQKYNQALSLVNNKQLRGLSQMIGVTQDALTTILDSTNGMMNNVVDRVSWQKPIAGLSRMVMSLSDTVMVLLSLVQAITQKLVGQVLEQRGAAQDVGNSLNQILDVVVDIKRISGEIGALATGQRLVDKDPAAVTIAPGSPSMPPLMITEGGNSSEDKELLAAFAKYPQNIPNLAAASEDFISTIVRQNSPARRLLLIDSLCRYLYSRMQHGLFGGYNESIRDTQAIDRARQEVEKIFQSQPRTYAGYGAAVRNIVQNIISQNADWRKPLLLLGLCSTLKQRVG
jgi:hypothetical protein